MSRVLRFIGRVRDAFYQEILGQKPYDHRKTQEQVMELYERGALCRGVSPLSRFAWPGCMGQR